MNDKLYNSLKYLCQIALPALGSLYFGLAQIWNLPFAEQVVGTIACITTFIGVLIGVSSYRYYKGIDNADKDE